MSASENSHTSDSGAKISLTLQPLKNIAFGKRLDNQASASLSSGILWFITGLAVIVLFSACINYTNLSIARFLKRSPEVCIRKVMGAQRFQVASQFMMEAIIMSLISLTLAIVIFVFIRPQFLSLTPNLQRLLSLDMTPTLIGYFVLFAISIGILAGLLPGFFYAKINPIKAIKTNSTVGASRPLTGRKALIVIQYVFSFIFITSTLIVFKQYTDFIAFDLGFKTFNILNINLQGNNPEIVARKLSELPEVNEISQSFMITSVGNNYYSYVKYNSNDSTRAWYNKVDNRYIPLLGIKIIAGQNFTEEKETVVINESLVGLLDIGNKDPHKAIGEFLTVDGKNLRIVGVAQDFHYSTIDRKIGPFMLRYSDHDFRYLNAMIISNNLPVTLEKLEQIWKGVDPLHPFEATFYDDQIQKAYSEYYAMAKIIAFLTLLTVVIASLGLLGMVVFTTETKLKEISIRKSFGADERNLIYLMGKGFLFMLIISAIISLPFTYLIFDKIVLSDVTYRSPIGVLELFSGILVVTVIALVMIGSQTFKAARSNPATVLKNE